MEFKCGECKKTQHIQCVCSSCGVLNKIEHPKISCVCESLIDEGKNYTIKEWIRFDFQKYLGYILNIVDKDSFPALKANTEEELKAGMLSDVQVGKLKEVMKEGFEKGYSLRLLSDEIKKNIDLKDRFRLKDGIIELDKKGEPILAIAAEHRPITIARTETVRLSNAGALEHYENEGAETITWVASYGERTCAYCDSQNGRIFSIQESRDLMNSDEFPAHPGCRCSLVGLGGR